MSKRIFQLLLTAGTLLLPAAARSQTAALTGASKWADSAAREIDAASDAGDVARLQSAQTLVDRALTAFPNDPMLLYYKAYALYRVAGLQEGLGHQDEVAKALDADQSALEASLAVK